MYVIICELFLKCSGEREGEKRVVKGGEEIESVKKKMFQELYDYWKSVDDDEVVDGEEVFRKKVIDWDIVNGGDGSIKIDLKVEKERIVFVDDMWMFVVECFEI